MDHDLSETVRLDWRCDCWGLLVGLAQASPQVAELALALGLQAHSLQERRLTLELLLDDRGEYRLFLDSELLALEVLMMLK